MEQVLPFENVPYDETVNLTNDISHMSAEQYLSWVRDQSAKMPKVFRATEEKIASISMAPSNNILHIFEDIPECPVDMLPSLEWERTMIHSFSELRSNIAAKSEHYKERLVQVPQMKDRTAWLTFCLGIRNPMNEVTTTSLESEEYVNIRKRKRELAVDCGIELDEVPEADEQIAEWGSQDGDIGEEEAEEAESSYPIWEGAIGAHPTLKLLLQFDQVLTQKVLMYLVEWLDDNGIDDAGLTQKIGQWIYSLLTRVEKPLHRDTVALIRQLYRCCCVMRNKLHGNISNDILEQRLATLNTLISISGYYFGQGEYYKSFEPIIEVDTNNQQNVKNLLEDGSSDEDDEMEADDDEIQISDDDDKDANEPPKKWKATTIDV